jgi:hypothetical protein
MNSYLKTISLLDQSFLTVLRVSICPLALYKAAVSENDLPVFCPIAKELK